MSKEEQSVDPSEVMEFLNRGQVVDLDISPEVLEASQPEPAEDTPPYDSPTPGYLDKGVSTEAKEQNWVLESDLIPDVRVEVTALERDLFWKAALCEEPVRFTIPVRGGMDVTVRSLSQFELDVLFAACSTDTQERVVITDGQYASQMQDYSLFLQVEKVGDRPFGHALDIQDLGFGLAVKALRSHHELHTKQVHAPTRSCLIHALRVFALKMKICTDNLHNENFWIPPAAD
jgi:hypothetical protein